MDAVRLRVERAGEHLHGLKLEVERLVTKFNREGVVRDLDPSTGDHVWKIAADPDETLRVCLLAGDFIHNLRSSLDHIVWELTDPTAREQRPLPEFPIYENPGPGSDGFHSAGIPKIWSLPIEAKVLIERMQPYQGGNKALLDIQRLDNIDKHRRLLTVPYGIRRTAMVLARPGRVSGVKIGTIGGGRFKHGDEVTRVAASQPAAEVENVQFYFVFQIALEEKGVSGPIVEKLTPLYEFVNDELLPQFEPFLS
jgi:hypothetical protein